MQLTLENSKNKKENKNVTTTFSRTNPFQAKVLKNVNLNVATDFHYKDELEQHQKDGVLTRLDTAFSRDKVQKVYVQHKILENSKELFDWL